MLSTAQATTRRPTGDDDPWRPLPPAAGENFQLVIRITRVEEWGGWSWWQRALEHLGQMDRIHGGHQLNPSPPLAAPFIHSCSTLSPRTGRRSTSDTARCCGALCMTFFVQHTRSRWRRTTGGQGRGESTTGGNTEYTQQVCVVGVEWWLAEGVPPLGVLLFVVPLLLLL